MRLFIASIKAGECEKGRRVEDGGRGERRSSCRLGFLRGCTLLSEEDRAAHKSKQEATWEGSIHQRTKHTVHGSEEGKRWSSRKLLLADKHT